MHIPRRIPFSHQLYDIFCQDAILVRYIHAITLSRITSANLNFHHPNLSAAVPNTPDRLPFNPTITPAMGVAGVVLMLAGMVLALVGIKSKWYVAYFLFLLSIMISSWAFIPLYSYQRNPGQKSIHVTSTSFQHQAVACLVLNVC